MQVTEEEKQKYKRILQNMYIDISIRYQKNARFLNDNDRLGKKMYDSIIAKAIEGKWLPFLEIKTYLEKLTYFMKKEQEDPLQYADECIRYTVLVDQFQEKMLEVPIEIISSFIQALQDDDVSYTQYHLYGSWIVNKQIIDKIETSKFPFPLSRVLQSAFEEIPFQMNQEAQIKTVLQSLETSASLEHQKSLYGNLCEATSFSLEELSSALLEQMHYLEEYMPNIYTKQEQITIQKIPSLQYLPLDKKESYIKVIQQLLHQSLGIQELLKKVINITDVFYEQLKGNTIIYYDFQTRKEHQHENR